MNILSVFKNLIKRFNEYFEENTNLYNMESFISKFGDEFTIDLFINTIDSINNEFKLSKKRKDKYYVKETKIRPVLTSMGWVDIPFISFEDKKSKKLLNYTRDILNLKPYQRISDTAEYLLIKFAMENNYSMAAKYAIKNAQVSRTTVANKVRNLNGNLNEKVEKTQNQPNVLYIEMDEVHANLQNKNKKEGDKSKNKICPCAIVHEGHKDSKSKRKQLKNVKNFATTNSYEDLWEVIYDYCDKRYDLNKFEKIFISGDGASGIKAYDNVFPEGTYVLDPFHFKKDLKYLFKKNNDLIKTADDYLRNDKINDFKILCESQIELYPKSKKYMIQKQNHLISNTEGIKNQHDPLYECHCSMEGHVSNKYARYITTSPQAYSEKGLKNKLKLLVMRADGVDLSFNDFLHLKYEKDRYETIIKNTKSFKTNFKLQINQNEVKNNGVGISIPKLKDVAENNALSEMLSQRKRIRYI